MGHLGQMPLPPPPFGGIILLITILNFMSGLDQLTHMYILLAFITNSPEIKANQSQTSCEIASCILSTSKIFTMLLVFKIRYWAVSSAGFPKGTYLYQSPTTSVISMLL